jgi:F-type H+-transporting ATPase subunit b
MMSPIRTLQWAVAGGILVIATLAFAGSEQDAHHQEGDAHELDVAAEHGADHGHVPTWDDINWAEGLLFESEESEPGLLTRKPGTPVPFLAMALNSALLFWLLISVGGPKIREALKARKAGITSGMEQAAAMRDDAEARLKEYEDKLAHIDQQIEASRQQIQDLAKVERDQVLKEARAKRDRMLVDAHQLISQELKAAREILMEETVKSAMKAAQEMITQATSAADEQRFQAQYLESLRSTQLSARGGA